MKDPEKFKERMGNFMKGLLAKQKENQAKRDAAKAVDGAKDMIFVLEPYEQVQLYEWWHEHNKTCRMRWNEDGTPIEFPGGAAGGTLTYSFTPTGLGMAIYARCACNEEVNLTDYESW